MSNVLRRPQVIARTGLKRSAIYEQMSAGTFPKCIKLGPRAVGWLETEIDDWIQSRIQASRGGK
jgi:prophage regulatory protein